MNLAPHFENFGYLTPIPFLEAGEAEAIVRSHRRYPDPLLPWLKGRHAVDATIAAIASHPTIVETLIPILGNDILLWGSQIIVQQPGRRSRWHIDQEHKVWEGVSVWIGLKNVQALRSVSLVAGSHRFNIDPSELLSSTTPLADVVAAISPTAKIIDLAIKDGEFFVFAGKTWHATRNETQEPRFALLLQYCKPDQKVRAVKDIRYPHITFHSFRPECLLISGTDRYNLNKVIKPEEAGNLLRKLSGALIYAPRTLLYKARRKLLSRRK